MKKCLIISGGEFSGFENLAETSGKVEEYKPGEGGAGETIRGQENSKTLKVKEFQKNSVEYAVYDLIIAADKGADYARRLNIVPDIIIGDFDSCEAGPGDVDFDSCGTGTGDGDFDSCETAEKLIPTICRHAPHPDFASCSAAADPLRLLRKPRNKNDLGEASGKNSFRPAARGDDSGIPEIIRLPREKDFSDTFYAVKYALGKGCFRIDIICIMGGRFDHMLSNLQTAAYAASRGARCRLIGERDIIHVFCGGEDAKGGSDNDAGDGRGDDIKGGSGFNGDIKDVCGFSELSEKIIIKKRAGWSVSAFALSEKCEGVKISGSLYDEGALGVPDVYDEGTSGVPEDDSRAYTSLEAEPAAMASEAGELTLRSLLPQGLSNEFASGSSEISYSLRRGILAVVESRM